VKRLKYQRLTEDLMGKFNQELAILSRVRHRNVVAFVGAVTEQPHLCVVMEYMEAGTLHSAIHSGGLTLTLPRLLEVCCAHTLLRRPASPTRVTLDSVTLNSTIHNKGLTLTVPRLLEVCGVPPLMASAIASVTALARLPPPMRAYTVVMVKIDAT
jgi:serine/threonine protein kinase